MARISSSNKTTTSPHQYQSPANIDLPRTSGGNTVSIHKVPEDHPLPDTHQEHTDTDDHIPKPQPLTKPEPAQNTQPEKNNPVEQPVAPQQQQPDADAAPGVVAKTSSSSSQQQAVLTKHGTGPTTLGYVVDLVYERDHAEFRHAPLPTVGSNLQTVAQMAGESAVEPCDYLDGRTVMQRAACRDVDARLVAYNSAPFERTWCGKTIAPHTAVSLEDHDHHCHEPVHLFPNEQDAPVNGQGMPPIVVQSQPGLSKQGAVVKSLTDIPCDIPCQFEADMDGSDRFIAGTDWKITFTDDDPVYNERARIERTAFSRNEYYATTSFQSSVPLSSYSFEKYNLRNAPAVDFDKVGNKATYLLNEKCMAGSVRRNKWFGAVDAGYGTEAYGSCSHNTDLQNGESIDTAEGRIQLYQKNRFALAFELGMEKDHITPIVWEALMSGSLPAILGATNAANHLPPKAAIYTSAFNNWDKFATFVKEVSENKALWESYHAWRTDEAALSAFETRYNFTRTAPECRLCRWAYAKKYGLGWDHQQQVVKDTQLKRQLCVDESTMLATRPFQEEWKEHEEAVQSGSDKCFAHSSSSDATIKLDNGATITRSVVHHDGVTDMILQNVQGWPAASDQATAVLHIKVGVRNSEGAYFRDTHTLTPNPRNPLISSATIQDEFAKVTVLANWETQVFSPREGVMEIHIQPPLSADEIRRIRVIGEDISQLHDKMTEFNPSSFGAMMTRDFVEPLELFRVSTSR